MLVKDLFSFYRVGRYRLETNHLPLSLNVSLYRQVRIWRVRTTSYLDNKSASVTQREAPCSSPEYRQPCYDIPLTKQTESPQTPAARCSSPYSTNLQASTPETTVKMSSLQSIMEEKQLQISEDNMTSPSSVLSPPSLKRRTIRDYFVTAS